MVLAGTEAAASEAVEEASAEETVEDSEGAIKWEEGESLVQHRLSMATRGRHWSSLQFAERQHIFIIESQSFQNLKKKKTKNNL